MSTPTVSARAARRLLLGAQGLLDDPRRPASIATLRRLIDQLGFVQLDSINTVARAQHLTLHTRLAGYRPAQLDHLLETERFLFEHWTHDASAIPMSLYAYWRPRFRRAEKRILANAWWRSRLGRNHRATCQDILAHVRREGEVRSQDLEGDGDAQSEGWWGWKPQKAALEFLWHTGALAVVRRAHFHKVYALAEDVLAEAHARPEPSPAEHLDWACRTALDRLGVATARELAGYWAALPLADARRWVAEAARSRRIVPVHVESEGGTKALAAWAWPDWEERVASLPEPPPGLRLLCPFDPVLRDRARALRLFGFDYRFEAFVPQAKRKYGYYVLSILEGERLIGRIDPKLDRERGVLEVRRVFWEPGVGRSAARTARLTRAVEELARWLGADEVELGRRAGQRRA